MSLGSLRLSKEFIEILRPSVCVLSISAVFVGAVVSDFLTLIPLLVAMIVAFLVAGAGNTLNDYFDYESDKINKPHRPIPSGRISKNIVLKYTFFLFTISLPLFVFLNVSCSF